jgi:hypothetical protein
MIYVWRPDVKWELWRTIWSTIKFAGQLEVETLHISFFTEIWTLILELKYATSLSGVILRYAYKMRNK